MKKRLLFVFWGLVVLLAGCGRLKKSSENNPPKIPPKDPFYNCKGFRDWYRIPLKYPYQVIMIDNWDDGSLEKYDGGNLEDPNRSSHSVMLENIIDLHLHEDYAFFRKEDWTYGYLQYSTGETRLFETEEELKQTCFLEAEDFKPLEYYYKLFEKGTVMYPPPDPAKKKEIRFHVISHFHGLSVKMVPEAAYSNGERGPAVIRVVSGDTSGDIEIETGKLIFGYLPQKKQDTLDKWLSTHRDELLEMWETQKLKEIPPLE